MKRLRFTYLIAAALSASLILSVTACGTNTVPPTAVSSAAVSESSGNASYNSEKNSSKDGEHAIEVDGKTEEYSDVKVTKTGDSSSGDEADFYGDNAAIFATNGATLTLKNIGVETNGTHANAVFSYGEGTTVNISDSDITTTGNCSGGIMTTGGGTMNATNLNIHTTGQSSAAIRSDRGGGTVNVDGGTYLTEGKGSPAIYSTANITVSNASLESTTSEGVVVEGRNSVTLNNVTLTADNNANNSDKSDNLNGVMIYQSMSGDAAVGAASFTMNGGTFINKSGDVFFVNNTTTNITLQNVRIENKDVAGVFLRAAAAGWGTEGSNGGKVNLYLRQQTLEGDIAVDGVSVLNMYVSSGSSYTGAVNADNKGQVYVEIEKGSRWILSDDSYVSSLTCDSSAIDLNGHTLYVNGVKYTSGTASEGTAIEIKTESSASGTPDGLPGNPPSGEKPQGDPPVGEKPQGDPPSGDPPSGAPGSGETPPSKPDN